MTLLWRVGQPVQRFAILKYLLFIHFNLGDGFVSTMIVFLVTIPLYTASLYGRPQKLQPNIRESCRLDLTGAYFNAYDEKERMRHLVRALKEQLMQVEGALKKYNDVYHKAKIKSQAQTYDRNVATSLDEAYGIKKSYDDQKKLLIKQISESEESHKIAIEKEKILRQSLEPLLILRRFEDRPDGGYPIESQFKSPCPPYRSLCILPQKDLDILAKIKIDGQLPESCARYLTLGRSPGPASP